MDERTCIHDRLESVQCQECDEMDHNVSARSKDSELTHLRAIVKAAEKLAGAAELVHEQSNVSGADVTHHAWINLDDALSAFESAQKGEEQADGR